MNKQKYEIIENYMRSCMDNNDTAHGYQHVYRVLYNALEICKEYKVDNEVLIVSSLLHDIGRDSQCKNDIDHAKIGAEMAYLYLTSNGRRVFLHIAAEKLVVLKRFLRTTSSIT